MRAIPRAILVWATLKTGTTEGAEIRFPDVPELRGKRIIGFEGYDNSFLTKTPDLQDVVGGADSVKLTLVLKDLSKERIQDIPFITLIPAYIGGIWKQVEPFEVNWQSSFVRVVDTPATLPVTVPFCIFYE